MHFYNDSRNYSFPDVYEVCDEKYGIALIFINICILCGDLDGAVSLLNEGFMAILRKRVESGTSFGKQIIMENLPPDHKKFALSTETVPNNNNGWIEWDVPLGGEMDEPMVDTGFDEEVLDDDDNVWDEDEEWLMVPMTPPGATVTVSSTYKMETMSDTDVANSIAIGEIYPRVTIVEEQVQTLQMALHGAELQMQQLRTRLSEMESREDTMMSYMLWMEERLTVLEKRLPGPPLGP
ncbi:hypothetical protein Tco_1133129, partial [Tanacetum coccineum]